MKADACLSCPTAGVERRAARLSALHEVDFLPPDANE